MGKKITNANHSQPSQATVAAGFFVTPDAAQEEVCLNLGLWLPVANVRQPV
jgi:hypothetical protein